MVTEVAAWSAGPVVFTVGVLNNLDMDIDSNGSFTLYLGGEAREKNWLALTPGASRITTRHYFEHPRPAAADPEREPRMRIDRPNPYAGMTNPMTMQAVPGPPEDKRVLYVELIYPFEKGSQKH